MTPVSDDHVSSEGGYRSSRSFAHFVESAHNGVVVGDTVHPSIPVVAPGFLAPVMKVTRQYTEGGYHSRKHISEGSVTPRAPRIPGHYSVYSEGGYRSSDHEFVRDLVIPLNECGADVEHGKRLQRSHKRVKSFLGHGRVGYAISMNELCKRMQLGNRDFFE
jgi:hypothetical protein